MCMDLGQVHKGQVGQKVWWAWGTCVTCHTALQLMNQLLLCTTVTPSAHGQLAIPCKQ